MRAKRKRIEVKIEGHVQGVFFRQGAMHQARILGLVGFVQNEKDGSVFVVAEGDEKELQKLIEWCKKGTDHSWVKKMEAAWKEAVEEFQDFQVKN